MKKTVLAAGLLTVMVVTAGCSLPDGTSTNNTQSGGLNRGTQEERGEGNQMREGMGEGMGQERGNGTQMGTQGGMPPMMQPQTPPALTDEQTQQLAAGKADHKTATLTFNMNAGSFYFVPNEIHVKKGDTVKIVLIDDGGHHNLTLDEFNVNIGPLDGGQTGTAEFIADKAGTFEYYCNVGKHRLLGQKGTLVVEE